MIGGYNQILFILSSAVFVNFYIANGQKKKTTPSLADMTNATTVIYSTDDITKLPYSAYCKFQANKYKCMGERFDNRYFYDVLLQDCTTFDYGHCNHSYNVFTSRSACRSQCADHGLSPVAPNLTDNIFCRFQPDFGECNSYYPMWYFDVSELRCRGFAYSGCGGNMNRFSNSLQCLTVCGVAVKHD